MKKTCKLTITVLMLAAFTCSITYVNASDYEDAIMPIIIPNDPPWLGHVNEPVYFYANVGDPSELFIIYPPFDWEWRFEKTEGPPEAPDVFTKTRSWDYPYWGFYETFPYPCKYTVEIRVTNDLGSTLKWPMVVPCNVNYTLITYAPLTARIISGPTSGWTLEEYAWVGDASGGAPPYTFDWDFDYDGENFDEDVHDDRTPEWTYIVAGEYNTPKDYTVALRVTDDNGNTDIDTRVCTIDYSYKLDVWIIEGPEWVKKGNPATFFGFIINEGWETSPPYDIDAEVWWLSGSGWQKVYDWDIVTYPELEPWDPPTYPDHYYTFTYPRTRYSGLNQFWIHLIVDGVILDAQAKSFWVSFL